jgi:hypothetical protein
MKNYLVPLSLMSFSVILPFFPSFTPAASAACAMTDVGVQVAVHGSHDPAQQINNVNQQSGENCMGNVTTSVGNQLYVGPGSVEQVRNSSQYVGGDSYADPNYPGFNTPTIAVPVGVPVDVYAPAYDPSFYGNLPFSGSGIYSNYPSN